MEKKLWLEGKSENYFPNLFYFILLYEAFPYIYEPCFAVRNFKFGAKTLSALNIIKFVWPNN